MWDQRYAADSYVYGTEPNDFLRANLERLTAGETLCLAEGEGRNAVFLAAHGHTVSAVDASQVGLKKAQRLASESGVAIETIHADLADYRFDSDRWDTIVSIFCHLPIALRRHVHTHVARALKPGGVFVLEAYTPEQIGRGTGGPPVAELMMDLDSLRTELAALNIVHGVETVREINEGTFHTGTGAVVQLIAYR